MRVLDLFSGLGGWSAAFSERGHEVVTVDIDYRFRPAFCRDIAQLRGVDSLGGPFDVILASPPCEQFSLAAAHYHRIVKGKPQISAAARAVALMQHTFDLIAAANPRFWAVENPVGFARQVFPDVAATIDQCTYGREFKKPTDLWGGLPPRFEARRCRDKSNHSHTVKKPNGFPARGSVMNMWINDTRRAASLRAELPHGLSLEMCLACERDLTSQRIGQEVERNE